MLPDPYSIMEDSAIWDHVFRVYEYTCNITSTISGLHENEQYLQAGVNSRTTHFWKLYFETVGSLCEMEV